jgi:3-deoxy-manno-octulosonate cytidylyltransferase (CMP-KDO synthetase)
MKTVIIIPARYESSRFPGKPLVVVAGRSMIERVHAIAKAVAGVATVYVATDDARIKAAAEIFGAKVLMTSSSCRNGTERVAEAAGKVREKYDLVINLQGDAPLTPPHFITAMIDAMVREPTTSMATPAVRCDPESLARFKEDRRAGRVGGTTVVCRANGQALYFSKEVIPYVPEGMKFDPVPVLHHVGLYAYRPSLLMDYLRWPVGPLETFEGLEQLRVLENGGAIRVVEVDAQGRPFWEINNPQDVARVEAALAQHGDPFGPGLGR